VVAACVDQQVGGFQEVLHARLGHDGTSVAQMGGQCHEFFNGGTTKSLEPVMNLKFSPLKINGLRGLFVILSKSIKN
jgi:hypothetical protein